MMLYLTDYNEEDRSAIQDSFKTQFRDLRLKDFTDAFGVLKFKNSLPSPLMVENPYIFKISKGEASFLTLGTMHVLPLNVYPQKLIDLLLSNKYLVLESGGEESIALYETTPASPLTAECGEDSHSKELLELSRTPSKFEQDWFEDLSTPCQQFLDHALSEKLPNYAYFSLHDITEELVFINRLGHDDCMDHELFFSSAFEQRFHLENDEEHLDEFLSSSEADLLSTFSSDLEDHVNTIGTEGIYEIKSYLSGVDGKVPDEETYDKFVEERNLKWVERLKVESRDEVLVAVGCAHLFSHNGLLQLWEKDGWSIERVDLAGEFHAVELTADGLLA